MAATWFITGSSSGLGRELTAHLLARGDRVAATLRRPEAIDDLAGLHGDRLWIRSLDVTDTARLRLVVEEAFADLGRIDVVASIAGFGTIGLAEELTDEQIERQIDTNLIGSIQLARAVVPHLRAQGGGRILQMSSMGGQIAFPAMSLYHASKWGIEGFFEALAKEVEPFGIETTLIEPGMVATDFFSAADVKPSGLEAYAGTPAANLTHGRGVPQEQMPGDVALMAAAMIRVGDMDDPPQRQLLGSDAHQLVTAALSDRLREAQQGAEIAHSTDRAT